MLSPVSGEPFGAVGALGKLGAFGVLKLKVGGVGGVGGPAHSQVVHVAFVIMFIELVVPIPFFFTSTEVISFGLKASSSALTFSINIILGILRCCILSVVVYTFFYGVSPFWSLCTCKISRVCFFI
jgi:hypothetical protein